MPPNGVVAPPEPGLRAGLRLVLRLAAGIRRPVIAYVVLTAAATAAQAALVLLVGSITSGQGVAASGGSAILGSLRPVLSAVLFGLAIVVAVGGDFLADRVLIRARKDIAPTYFSVVAGAIRSHPSRSVLLGDGDSIAACVKLMMGGLSLGMALRLLLVGVVAAFRAVILLGAVFGLSGVPVWLGFVTLALIAGPLAVGSSRSIVRSERARPLKQRSARKAVLRASSSLAAVAVQARLPLDIPGRSAHHRTGDDPEEEAVAAAARAITVMSDSSTQRLLIATQANFRLEALAFGGFAVALAVIRLTGVEFALSESSASVASLALGLLLGLRAAGSALRSLVRLVGMGYSFLIRSEMLAVIEQHHDASVARRQLCLLADQLTGGAATDGDEDLA